MHINIWILPAFVLPFCVEAIRNVSYSLTTNKTTWHNVPESCRLVGINKTGSIDMENNKLTLIYSGFGHRQEKIWVGAYEEYSPSIRRAGCFSDSYITDYSNIKYDYKGDIYNINICINKCLALEIECKTIYLHRNMCLAGNNATARTTHSDDSECRYSQSSNGIKYAIGSPIDNCVCQYYIIKPQNKPRYFINDSSTISRRMWGFPQQLTSYNCVTITRQSLQRRALVSSVPCNESHLFACENGLTKWTQSTPSFTTVHTVDSTTVTLSTVDTQTTDLMSSISSESTTMSGLTSTLLYYNNQKQYSTTVTTSIRTTDHEILKSTAHTPTRMYYSSEATPLSNDISKSTLETITRKTPSSNLTGHHDIIVLEDNSLSIPIISGIAVGGFSLVLVGVVVTICYCKRKTHSREKGTQSKFSNMTYQDSVTTTDNAITNKRNTDHTCDQPYSVAYSINKKEVDLQAPPHIYGNQTDAYSATAATWKNIQVNKCDLDEQNNDIYDHLGSDGDKVSDYGRASKEKLPMSYNDIYDHLASESGVVDFTYGHGPLPHPGHDNDTYDHLGSEDNNSSVSATYDYGQIPNQRQTDDTYDHFGSETNTNFVSATYDYGPIPNQRQNNETYDHIRQVV